MKKPGKHSSKGGGSKKQPPKGAPMPPGPGMDQGPPPGLLAALGAGGPAGDTSPAMPMGGGPPAGPGASLPFPPPKRGKKGAP